MQTRNKFLDDMSQLFTNALGVAQGARTEAETAMRGMIDRWLAERDLATREEIDALREMVLKSRAETEAPAARVAALEAAASPAAPAAPKRARSAAAKG